MPDSISNAPSLNAGLCGQRIALCVLRSRITRVVLLSMFAFIFCSYTLEMFHQSKFIPTAYNHSKKQMWKEVYIPGQVRTIRVKVNKSNRSKTVSKTILLWTTYFSDEYSDDFYFFQEGRETFNHCNCEVSDCYVTSNRSLLPLVDAVLFHGKDFRAKDIPKRVRLDQIWILYSMEPPQHVLEWNSVGSLFNWTMTYRSDSHVQVKYGEVVQNDNSSKRSSYRRNDRFRMKKYGAVWMVSNCKTESGREAYVRELRKYMNVDVYGQCSTQRCEPSQSKKCYKILKKYMYYLSFENSICKDYVTEKFFNVLQYDIVPVVFGGADYSDVAPEHSFIDATRFLNPKDLADHLKAIAQNSSWYNSFFEWKDKYTVHLHPWMCDFCERLHQSNTTNTLARDLWSWWGPEASCRSWTKNGFRTLF